MNVFYMLSVQIGRLDTVSNRWLAEHCGYLLRVTTGLVLLEFGLIKLFMGGGPLNWLANHTLSLLSGGMLSVSVASYVIISLNCLTGVCFFTQRLIPIGVWLLVVQLIGATLPLLLFPGELALSALYAPTLVVQYLLTEILLAIISIFIAASWAEAQATQPDVRLS